MDSAGAFLVGTDAGYCARPVHSHRRLSHGPLRPARIRSLELSTGSGDVAPLSLSLQAIRLTPGKNTFLLRPHHSGLRGAGLGSPADAGDGADHPPETRYW